MTTMPVTVRLARRWPIAVALAAVAGCVVLIFGQGADVELAPGIATMMCVCTAAYAIGKPAAAWPAFGGAVLVALGFLAVGVDVGLGMTTVLVLLWVWALARGLARDGRRFGVETAGVFAFGAITVAALAVDLRLGGVLAGCRLVRSWALGCVPLRAQPRGEPPVVGDVRRGRHPPSACC